MTRQSPNKRSNWKYTLVYGFTSPAFVDHFNLRFGPAALEHESAVKLDVGVR
jgi:hypothetical protein